MFSLDYDGCRFYERAMELFFEAGHAVTLKPEFINHTAEQIVYFDGDRDAFITKEQRQLLPLFNNISKLFTFNDCVFFSINLLSAQRYRSQTAHDIHVMIHTVMKKKGSVCIFRYDDEILLSFMGYGINCILSDWYSMDDDDCTLSAKLDIANMSLQSHYDYFADMVYTLGRPYYQYGYEGTIYELIPVDALEKIESGELSRNELDQIVKDRLAAAETEYGDDFVEYDDKIEIVSPDISADLDMMLLEMNDEEDNPFGEDIEDEEEDDFFDEAEEETEKDYYEYESLDPALFEDPTLLVKYIKKQDSI